MMLRLARVYALSGALCLSASAWAAPGDPAQGQAKAQALACVACHGEAGQSSQAGVPHLAAQPPLSIFYQLLQFRDQRRRGGGMEAIAANLSEQDMRDLAAYFSQLPAPKGQPFADAALVRQGEQLAQAQFCSSCHDNQLQGQKHVPRLAGQRADYFLPQLQHLHSGERADMDGTMASAAASLSPADMAALSAYAQTLN